MDDGSKAVVGALACWAALLGGGTGSARGDDFKARFLAEYEPAAKKLEEFYGKVLIRGRKIEKGERPGAEAISDLVFRANGPLLRLDEANHRAIGNLQAETTRVRVANPRRSFALRKAPGAEAFTIDLLDRDYRQQVKSIRANAVIPFAPFSALELTVAEQLRQNEFPFNVKELTRTTRDGRELVRLLYAWELPPKPAIGQGPLQYVRWFHFAPNDGWALQEYGWGPPQFPNSFRAAIEYQGEQDGVPLVRRAEYWRQDRHGKRSEVVTFEVDELVPGPVSEEDFTLDAFGFADVGKRGFPTYLILLAAGVLAALAAVAFRYLARRRQSARAAAGKG